jgi:protein SCO1
MEATMLGSAPLPAAAQDAPAFAPGMINHMQKMREFPDADHGAQPTPPAIPRFSFDPDPSGAVSTFQPGGATFTFASGESMRRRNFLVRLGRAGVLILSARAFRATFAAAQVAAPPEGSSVHFALTTIEGAFVTEESYRGNWLVVYFGYTFCPDVCPTTMMDLANSMKVVWQRADATRVIFVTVDPQRDKPEILREYLNSFDPRFIGLTGTAAQISSAAKSFHVFYERNDADDDTYTYDHSAFIYLVDPTGKLAKAITDDGGSKRIVDALSELLGSERR